jgi:catechol 2,3-dioxygenase-like lactoylglutathione lyase family enzyme/mannose-6-phosphate isomerase-like protein (cupin superfamily)
MTDLFDLTTTYVAVADTTATIFDGGDSFWRRITADDPALAPVKEGWLVSSYRLTESWPNWEMHPQGDEIVHCRTGTCELVLERADGPACFSMTPGKTIVIGKGTWHTARVAGEVELLHITYGSGTTFKPASADTVGACEGTDARRGRDTAGPTRVIAYAGGGDLDGSRHFYTELLGMDVAMDDPVLGLTSPVNRSAQVLIPPAGFDDPQPQFGIDLGDPKAVDAAHAAAIEAGLRVVYPLRTEPWGVRRFFVEDPGGTVVNVLAHMA